MHLPELQFGNRSEIWAYFVNSVAMRWTETRKELHKIDITSYSAKQNIATCWYRNKKPKYLSDQRLFRPLFLCLLRVLLRGLAAPIVGGGGHRWRLPLRQGRRSISWKRHPAIGRNRWAMPLLPCRPSTCSVLAKQNQPPHEPGGVLCGRCMRTHCLAPIVGPPPNKRTRRAPPPLFSVCASNKWTRDLLHSDCPHWVSEWASECLSLNGSINKAKAERCSLSKCFREGGKWVDAAKHRRIDCWVAFYFLRKSNIYQPFLLIAEFFLLGRFEQEAKNSTEQISSFWAVVFFVINSLLSHLPRVKNGYKGEITVELWAQIYHWLDFYWDKNIRNYKFYSNWLDNLMTC
jgi:hypothetical protein